MEGQQVVVAATVGIELEAEKRRHQQQRTPGPGPVAGLGPFQVAFGWTSVEATVHDQRYRIGQRGFVELAEPAGIE